MTILDKLIRFFESFPGVGTRQAQRFAFYLLSLPEKKRHELTELIHSLEANVRECDTCHRYFTTQQPSPTCAICTDPTRDLTKLLIVERDTDLQAVERSGVYNGAYFVLGGTVPLLNAHTEAKLRGGALKALVTTRLDAGLREIILGFSVNPDGENTERYVRTLLAEVLPADTAQSHIRISHLGRGLSTGSELEYADPDTLKYALEGRTTSS